MATTETLSCISPIVLWHSKMDIDAAIHHISRQRASTTAAATQTMKFAPVLAAGTYAATASVPVIVYITPGPVENTAPAPVNENVASAHVSEYVAPSLVTEHETPAVLAPVVQIVQFLQVQDPQSQILRFFLVKTPKPQ